MLVTQTRTTGRTICVVEDDPAIRRGLADSLRFAGFLVVECADGPSARTAIRGDRFDLVLLDVVLPGMDGLAYLGELREEHPRLPVIMVTARGAEDDRVRGLRSGADDYVVKPFSSSELLARVEAVLRRSAERPLAVAKVAIEGGTLDLERREYRRDDGDVRRLTEREAEVIAYLARHSGRTVERAELLRSVWGLNPVGIDTRTIDMAVARLRDKLGAGAITTVRGKGYLFTVRASA